MKTIGRVNLKELKGVELTRPELKFLVGGCSSSSSKIYKICCDPDNGKCKGGEKTSSTCSGDLCKGKNYNCM